MPIDFSDLELNDMSPIYRQVIKYVKIKIATGEAAPGDQIPSRRMLSVILNVNPNTIQKCCKIMEDEGFLQSPTCARGILWFDETMAARIKQTLCIEETVSYIDEMKRLKLNKEQVAEIIDSYWAKGESDGEK